MRWNAKGENWVLLQTENMIEEVNKYKLNWKQHVNRMQNSRLLKLSRLFKPKRQRDTIGLINRWQD
jgi:hypothetical protein